MVEISAWHGSLYIRTLRPPHQRQFQAIVANKSGIVIRHRASSDTMMKTSVFGKRGEEGGHGDE